MNYAQTLDAPALGEASEPVSRRVRDGVVAYWRNLGLADSNLVERLTDECLERARRRLGREADDELLRRALEDAQRRFDHALAWALGLPPSQDHQPIAAARAAYLLANDRIPADGLFAPSEAASDFGVRLRRTLPRATPPEAPLAMAEAPLRFWLFKSPPHR